MATIIANSYAIGGGGGGGDTLSNPFRERVRKHESKRKSYESSERRFNNLSLRKSYKPKECQK